MMAFAGEARHGDIQDAPETPIMIATTSLMSRRTVIRFINRTLALNEHPSDLLQISARESRLTPALAAARDQHSS